MQRVVSINLNGNAYQVEENGYNALFAYLDATDAQVKDNPDRAQRSPNSKRARGAMQGLPHAAQDRHHVDGDRSHHR